MRRSSLRVRLVLTVLLLLVAAFAVVFLLQQAASPQSAASGGQVMTLDPQIVANLTALPLATPLSAQAANDLVALGELVKACDAYSSERRDQMLLQIDLIIHPAAMSRDVIIGLGANPRGRLLFALGNVTAIQWRLDDQPADSCLLPIGRRINDLLVEAGQEPVAVFEADP